MEYTQIVRATQAQFEQEEASITAGQAELDDAQALLDRRRKALKRKRTGFEKMLQGWQTLDTEVVSGKPAAAEESGDAREPGGDEDEAAA